MMRSGIYCITDVKKQRRYVGQSVHVSERMKQHLRKLKKGEHANKRLQADYNEDWRYFRLDLLEICPVERLGEREAYWSNYYDVFNPEHGYNKQPIRVDQLYVDPDDYVGSDK